MQFQIPQFIEMEDKIIGPLTLKQFLYLASAALIMFFLFFVIQFWIWIIFAIIFGFAAVLFAFVKVNGLPFEKVTFNAFRYYWKPRLYLWQRKRIEEKYELNKAEEERAREFTEKRGREKPAPRLQFGQLNNLWEQMLTSRKQLKREKAKPERYVLIRKPGGDRIAVKRVDYQ